jgi:phage baseplate assembly protein W
MAIVPPRDFVGQGWPFPVRQEPDHTIALTGGEEKIRQSIMIILGTAQGERLMRPDFGCGIHNLLFQPNTAALRSLVADSVRSALTLWEPRIDVVGVRAEIPPEGQNYLLIRIDYRIRSNNASQNMVYPFFLTEGVGE